jgi:hypothetical protein
MIPSLCAPLFSLDLRKATGFRLAPDRHAQVSDEARRRGWSLQQFLDWCLDQALDLAFLTPGNRAAVQQTLDDLRRMMPGPWTAFDVVNSALTQFFSHVRAGNLVLRAGLWQRNTAEKSAARAKRRGAPRNAQFQFEPEQP